MVGSMSDRTVRGSPIASRKNFWEISGYDANDWLMELSRLIGWSDWPYKKYIDI